LKPAADSSLREHQLLQAARGGDAAAFAMLVDESGPTIERLALRLVGHRQDAEDIAQESVVTAWKRLDGFRAEASFRTWICRILVRRALDLLRSRREPPRIVEEPASGVDPLARVAGAEIEARVHEAIGALPPVQRATMLLRVEQGLSYEEIAYVLGSTRNAERVNLIAARRTLAYRLRTVVDLGGDAS
jgi:RNA polymerase sigma-70 factor (ECF subfamily)